MEENLTKTHKLREILSINVKKHRKKLGFSQEKLAEVAGLSSQTINDIEGCRMWVSDKTITKLEQALHIEAYQLLMPVKSTERRTLETLSIEEQILDLEDKVIGAVHQQFREAIDIETSFLGKPL